MSSSTEDSPTPRWDPRAPCWGWRCADMPWPDHCEGCLQAATADRLFRRATTRVSRTGDARSGTGVWDTPFRAEDALVDCVGLLTFNSTHNLYGLAQCDRGTCQRTYVPVDAPGPPTSTGPLTPETGKGGFVQRVEIIVIPVVSISIIVLLVLVMSIVIGYYQKKQRKNLELTGLKYIRYGEIKSATNCFNEEHKIGEGGFGKVYKGMFKIDQNTTKELAIKCVKDPAAAKELKAELRILAQLDHRNVVQLVGFCNNDGWFRRGRGLYVCSELISNGPLDNRIFASSGHSVIEWPIRYEIIRGICAGLQYLHQDRNSNIVHMDFKPSNILLDEEMKPKIADFGLSRAFLNTRTHTYTKNVRGSYGYIAPEFIDNGRVSRQCDIYSLGILILGIVMGRGPPSTSRDPSGVLFINNIRDKFIVDSTTTPNRCRARDHNDLKREASLQDNDCIEDVEKCVGIAFECVNAEPRNRPAATDMYTRLIPVIPSDNRVHITLQGNQL